MKTERKSLLNEKNAEFNRAFDSDRRLFAAAARVNFAYCDALFHAGVVTRLESERIKNGLQTIIKRAEFDRNYFGESAAEDVHSFIETRLVGLIGEAGEKINVGRSRYEQTATALRFWLRGEIVKISKNLRDLQSALIEAGERQKEAVLPAYANSQKAQTILWAHWCLAYYEMFSRDRERLDEVWRRVNVLPLGADFLAGTAFEIDREEVARALDFEGVSANSLDAVADRDFAVEFLAACALLIAHLARLAEDFILYSSAEFGYVEFAGASGAVSNYLPVTNSNNLEIVRGKAGRIFGYQVALLSTMKNLPLGIHRDLQETEEAVFDTVDTVNSCLLIMKNALENLRLSETKTRAATKGYLNADELADYLIQRNVSSGVAKKTVGEIISYAVSQKKELSELSLMEMRQFSDCFGDDIHEVLSLEQILAGKNQIGGTAPERVFEALDHARTEIQREEDEQLPF
jgi:argininosuccinate lyase